MRDRVVAPSQRPPVVLFFPVFAMPHRSFSILAILLPILITLPATSAHGKITYLTGSSGGNTTALGIIGAIVPNTGPNSETEVDTTVFKGGIKSDGLGKTEGGGENRGEDLWIARGLSGKSQQGDGVALVGKKDGWVEGVWHVVVTVCANDLCVRISG